MGCTEVSGPGLGVMNEDIEFEVVARGGNVCEGYCYPLALSNSSQISADSAYDPVTGASSAVVVSVDPGKIGYVFGNVANGPGTVDLRSAKYVIALSDIADQKIGRVKLAGRVKAKVQNSANTSIAIGDPLKVLAAAGAFAAANLDAKIANTANVPRKVVGYAEEAYTSTPSDGTTMFVLFDGWQGFGGVNL